MGWETYELDRAAQRLVLQARGRDPKSLNQSYKMRMAVAYGLERFWGCFGNHYGKSWGKNS